MLLNNYLKVLIVKNNLQIVFFNLEIFSIVTIVPFLINEANWKLFWHYGIIGGLLILFYSKSSNKIRVFIVSILKFITLHFNFMFHFVNKVQLLQQSLLIA